MVSFVKTSSPDLRDSENLERLKKLFISLFIVKFIFFA